MNTNKRAALLSIGAMVLVAVFVAVCILNPGLGAFVLNAFVVIVLGITGLLGLFAVFLIFYKAFGGDLDS
jgi:hypothetical protein